MATPVVFNSVNYSIPAFGDVGYAQGPGNLSAYLIAIATGTFQPTGGLFSLTADADFGPNFGLKSVYYKTQGTPLALTGVFRMARTEFIAWRDQANANDLELGVNASNQLTYNGVAISSSSGALIGTTLTLTATSNQMVIGTGTTTTVSFTAPAASSVYTVPDVGTTANFVMTAGTQSIAGSKTFTDPIIQNDTTNQIVLGLATTTTISATAPAASRVYTIPDVLGAADFLLTAGAQTIAGAKTFADQTLKLQETGGTDVVTINVAALAASRAYTVPDAGASASFVMTEGAQTVNGVKTFGSGVLAPVGSVSSVGYGFTGTGANTGLYVTGAEPTESLNIAVRGVQVWSSNSAGFFPFVPVQVTDGSVGAPSIAFQNSTTTGLFRQAADKISVTTAGFETMRLGSAGSADGTQWIPISIFSGTAFGGGVASTGFGIRTTAAVSTVATIIGGTNYSVIVVTGVTGGGATTFIDLLIDLYAQTPTLVLAKNNGAPAARTYGLSGDQITLAMASGTYSIAFTQWNIPIR